MKLIISVVMISLIFGVCFVSADTHWIEWNSDFCGSKSQAQKDCSGEVQCWTDSDWDGYVVCLKQSDWSCDDSSYVQCGNTETCGSSNAWCDNFLSGGKSCIPGEDWCCYDGGYIADYVGHRCCPPSLPFLHSNNYCYARPDSSSNNYYTRLFECDPDVVFEKCLGNSVTVCTFKGFIYKWDYRGIEKGKCGVECFGKDERCVGREYQLCGEDFKFYSVGELAGKCGVVCIEDSDCAGDLVCVSDSMRISAFTNPMKCSVCREDSDCDKNYECIDNDCVVIPKVTITDYINNFIGWLDDLFRSFIDGLNLGSFGQQRVKSSGGGIG